VAKKRAGGAGADQHYDGKLHYPAAVYGKKKDGTVVSRLVKDAAEYEALQAEDGSITWAASPADHGLETQPAGSVIDPATVGTGPAAAASVGNVGENPKDDREADAVRAGGKATRRTDSETKADEG
jgi:hypothetical protein